MKNDLNLVANNLVFSGIGQVVAKANALNDSSLIRLEIGDTDFSAPPLLLSCIESAFKKGKTHYSSFAGEDDLISAIQNKCRNEYNVPVDKKRIIVTAGGSMGLFLALSSILNFGDEVIILTPAWPHFSEIVKMANGVPIEEEMSYENNYKIDFDRLEKKINGKTKAIIINSPSNPTGKVITNDEVRNLVKIAMAHDVYIISDEEYYPFIYTSAGFHSPLGLYDKVFIIRSFSKEYAIPGLRLGYVIVPMYAAEVLTKLSLFSIMYNSTLIQSALAEYISKQDSYSSEMVEEYCSRRDFFIDKISEISEIDTYPAEGGMYIWCCVDQACKDDILFADKLMHAGVVTVPGSYFGKGGRGFLRISLSADKTRLERAINIIKDTIIRCN